MESWLVLVPVTSIVVLFFLVRRVARRLKERADGQVNQIAHEMPALRIIRPLLAIGFYAALLDWLVPGRRLGWSYHASIGYLQWGGAVGCVVAVAVLGWSFETLGRDYRGGVGLWDDHQLVTDGPYAWVRHPIYAAFVLLMISLWAMSANWLLGGTGVLLTSAIPALRLKTEERQLEERFGVDYAVWSRSTKRFIPWIV